MPRSLFSEVQRYTADLSLFERVSISAFIALIATIIVMAAWSILLLKNGQIEGGGPLGQTVGRLLDLATHNWM